MSYNQSSSLPARLLAERLGQIVKPRAKEKGGSRKQVRRKRLIYSRLDRIIVLGHAPSVFLLQSLTHPLEGLKVLSAVGQDPELFLGPLPLDLSPARDGVGVLLTLVLGLSLLFWGHLAKDLLLRCLEVALGTGANPEGKDFAPDNVPTGKKSAI